MCIAPSVAVDTMQKPSMPISNGKTLYVGGSGPNNYTKIQDAINDANDGDTVFVYNGIYYEEVSISKSINLIGEDKNNTIIDGQYKIPEELVKLKANSIYFSGFSVIHSKDWANDLGVAVYSSHNVVEDNIISDNPGTGGGLVIRGEYNYIKNNIIRNSGEDNGQGIKIGYQSHYNVVSGNTIEHNFVGIRLGSNHDNIIIGNHISNNNAYGIMISRVGYSEVCNNIIEDNYFAAIDIDMDSTDVVVNGNIIKNNGKGLVIRDASSLTVTMNSFYDNGIEFRNKKLYYWISHNIYDNTINGKPLYYFKSEKDLVVPSDAGQLILVDCNNCIVKNLHISNVDYGILIGFSTGITVSYSDISDIITCGIRLYLSSDCSIENNLIKNNGIGICIIGDSFSNIIRYNIIEKNEEYGIQIDGGLLNTIHRNTIKRNGDGICIYTSYDNTVSENNFIFNRRFHAYFQADEPLQRNNKWIRNYWNRPRIFPKFIFGDIRTPYFYYDQWTGEEIYIYRPGLNIDWHPAQKPYDIGV